MCGGAQRPKPVSESQLTRFHSDDYINFLKIITPDNMNDYLRQLQRCECSMCCGRRLAEHEVADVVTISCSQRGRGLPRV